MYITEKLQVCFPREFVNFLHQKYFLQKMRKLYSEDKPEGLKYWIYTSSFTYLLNKEHWQLLQGSMFIADIFDMRTFYTYNLTSSI